MSTNPLKRLFLTFWFLTSLPSCLYHLLTRTFLSIGQNKNSEALRHRGDLYQDFAGSICKNQWIVACLKKKYRIKHLLMCDFKKNQHTVRSALTSCGSVAGGPASIWSSLDFSVSWTLLTSAGGSAFFLNILPKRRPFSSLLFLTSSFWMVVSGILEMTAASTGWHCASITT